VSLRLRLVLATSVAVLIALVGPALIMVWELHNDLLATLDAGLRTRSASVIAHLTAEDTPAEESINGLRPPELGETDAYVQVVNADGSSERPDSNSVVLPVGPTDIAVAKGTHAGFARDVTVGGVRLRMLTRPVEAGVAVQVARPLGEVDATLREVRRLLLAVLLVGVVAAGALGWLTAAAALRPLTRLTRAAEEVARTRDLSLRMDADSRDELGRLAASMDSMLEALQRAVSAQRQLVADASHELRTPLTSLRTNVEVLQDVDRLDAVERRRLLDSTVFQLDELAALVADLVELARGDGSPAVTESAEVRLDRIVAAVLERARRHWPDVHFDERLEPTVVVGDAARLDRAVANLVDNAGKWSPPGGTVEVSLLDRRLTVRDHGPGIPPEDLPYVFDRFYRSPEARTAPGSGLGLAIVRQTADSHGATVEAGAAPDGGALLALQF
jgi:two-component system sensor histidine kinase MprB